MTAACCSSSTGAETMLRPTSTGKELTSRASPTNCRPAAATNCFNSGVGDAVLAAGGSPGSFPSCLVCHSRVTQIGGTLNTPGTAQTGKHYGRLPQRLHAIGSEQAMVRYDRSFPTNRLHRSVTLHQPRPRQYRKKPVPRSRLLAGQCLDLQEIHDVPRICKLEIRIDAFQLSNTPQFGQPNRQRSNLTSANFGTGHEHPGQRPGQRERCRRRA